jgi:HSP20 family protein
MSPFTMMREFTDEMDRWFRGDGDGSKGGGWSPAIDVQRCDGTMVVSAELPGLKKEDVKVDLTNDLLTLLTIEGERKREHREDHEGFHRWERSYGHFHRSVALPEGANTDRATAELKDGVLKVVVPVPEMKKEIRHVPIAEGTTASPPAR